MGLPYPDKKYYMLRRFDTIPERDRQTDGRTEFLY